MRKRTVKWIDAKKVYKANKQLDKKWVEQMYEEYDNLFGLEVN